MIQVTLMIQKTIEYENDEDYEKKLNKIVIALEKAGWSVSVESQEFEDDEDE